MAVSRRRAPRASRAFVTTPYQAVDGGMRAAVPARGPCWEDGAPCRIGIHHHRVRKTGIPFGLVAVARCGEHGLAFTLYPQGHVPYGREPWVALAPDGSELERGTGEESTGPSVDYFAAAGDAARGERWPRDSAPSPPGAVRSTQRRRLARAATLLGLDADALAADTVAAVTGLPAGELIDTARGLARPRDLVRWGRAALDTLGRLARRAGRALMDRLAVLGHLCGSWGRPYRWLSPTARLLEIGRPFWRDGPAGTSSPSPTARADEDSHDFGARAPP